MRGESICQGCALRTPEKVFQDKLPAPVGQYQERVLRPPRSSSTSVSTLPSHGCTSGIPVCRLGDDKWDVNVMQRVPLNIDRDNVPGSFRQELRAVPPDTGPLSPSSWNHALVRRRCTAWTI